jgi:hypothetical protein
LNNSQAGGNFCRYKARDVIVNRRIPCEEQKIYWMSRFSRARNLSAIIVAMAMGLLAARGASGGKPYLKVTGPPPLRFEFVAANNAPFLALLTLPTQKESSITNMPPPKPESARAETYTSGDTIMPVISNGGFPYGMFPYGASPYGGMYPYGMSSWGAPMAVRTGPAAVSTNSASNMLSVTPQMINDYFKPNPTEPAPTAPSQYQPGDAIMVPQELGFVPPPTIPQSQSSYTSK